MGLHNDAIAKPERSPTGDTHDHTHAPKDFGNAFLLGITLNLTFVAIEATYGFIANSMALLADAGHNLSDVLGLILAWGAATLAKRPPTPKLTYGLGSSSILAALANAMLLMVAVGAIAWEAIGRLTAPEPVAPSTVMIVATIGIVINAATAWLFSAGRHDDLNIKGAYLHMAADAAVSFGVVVAAGLIMLTGWMWLDPVVSLLIAAIIVWGTWDLLRDALIMAVQGVPRSINEAEVRRSLLGLNGVEAVHDLHIWAMSTTDTALTVHLVMPGGSPGDAFLAGASHMLHEHFDIRHVTLQIERGDGPECGLRPDTVV